LFGFEFPLELFVTEEKSVEFLLFLFGFFFPFSLSVLEVIEFTFERFNLALEVLSTTLFIFELALEVFGFSVFDGLGLFGSLTSLAFKIELSVEIRELIFKFLDDFLSNTDLDVIELRFVFSSEFLCLLLALFGFSFCGSFSLQ